MDRPVRDAHQEEVADGQIYQPCLQVTMNAETGETFSTTPQAVSRCLMCRSPMHCGKHREDKDKVVAEDQDMCTRKTNKEI